MLNLLAVYSPLKQEPDQTTPYFQMFNRNPYVVEPMNVCMEEDNMFAKIFEATKRASQALEEEKTSDCQVNGIISNFPRMGTEEREDGKT